MLTLMREGGTHPENRQRWLCLALAYFHDLPLKAGRIVRKEDKTADEKGMTIRIGGSDHWIPKEPSHVESRPPPG